MAAAPQRKARPTALLAAAVAAVVAVAIAVPDASAQEQQPRRRNLFEFLFGGPVRQVEPIQRPTKPRQKARTNPSKTPISQRPAAPVVEKIETAKSILVVGDFLGGGLAEALSEVFASNPEVRVANRTNGSSGFVRNDFYDWPSQIDGLIEAEKPAAVVVMIGANDRQEMRVGDVREPKRSEAWTKEYEARVATLATAVSKHKIPLLWVGVPSLKSTATSSDMLALNDIYREAAEKAGGEFVDIWDGFVDENGVYAATGPDINGQPVRLRSGDNGVNLTKPGKRKVAFYVEKPLDKILNGGAAPLVGALSPGALPNLAPDGGPRPEINRTNPISLTDPDLDGGSELLGGAISPPPGENRNPAEKLAVEGIAPPATPGRADDFTPAKDALAAKTAGEAQREKATAAAN